MILPALSLAAALLQGPSQASFPSPGPRAGPALTWDAARGMVLLFGGESSDPSDHYPRSLWGWDGRKWLLLSSDGPVGRQDAELGFDAARGVVVLYGGRRIERGAMQRLTDSWAWDGTRWHELSGTDAGARIHFSMSSGLGSDSLALLGGADDDSPTGQRLGRTGWHPAPLALPPGRFPITIARGSDGTPRLLAGTGTDRGIRAEVWTWASNGWEPNDSAGPFFSPRGAASATADGLVLHLGWEEDDAPAATWAWAGSAGWRLVAGDGPGRRRGTAMAYDAARGVALLYGGDGAEGLLDDLWLFDGHRWRRPVD